MSLINIDETLDSMMTEIKKLKLAKDTLDTFVRSHEGDSKMNTNTLKEDKTILYWENQITTKRTTSNNAVLYQENLLAQALANYEKAKLHLEQQIEQTKLTAETSIQSFEERLSTAKAEKERKLTKLKPKEQIRLEKQVEEHQRRILFYENQKKEYDEAQKEDIRKYEARRDRRR
jgi:hypothetical protein